MSSQRRQVSKKILSAAWSELKKDKSLIALPIIGGTLSLISILLISAIGLVAGAFNGLSDTASAQANSASMVGYVFAAILAYVSTVSAIFFQCAVIAGAQERLSGGDPTVGSAIRSALKHLPKILLWSLIATTVGLILRAISNQKNIGGSIVSALVGFAWAVATFFVLPVLMVEGIGPIKAISRSSALMKATWGAVLRTNIRYGISVFFIVVGLFAAMVGGGVWAASANSPWPILLSVVALVALGILCVVLSALNGYVRVMLYRYATSQTVPGFDQELLSQAMVIRS